MIMNQKEVALLFILLPVLVISKPIASISIAMATDEVSDTTTAAVLNVTDSIVEFGMLQKESMLASSDNTDNEGEDKSEQPTTLKQFNNETTNIAQIIEVSTLGTETDSTTNTSTLTPAQSSNITTTKHSNPLEQVDTKQLLDQAIVRLNGSPESESDGEEHIKHGGQCLRYSFLKKIKQHAADLLTSINSVIQSETKMSEYIGAGSEKENEVAKRDLKTEESKDDDDEKNDNDDDDDDDDDKDDDDDDEEDKDDKDDEDKNDDNKENGDGDGETGKTTLKGHKRRSSKPHSTNDEDNNGDDEEEEDEDDTVGHHDSDGNKINSQTEGTQLLNGLSDKTTTASVQSTVASDSESSKRPSIMTSTSTDLHTAPGNTEPIESILQNSSTAVSSEELAASDATVASSSDLQSTVSTSIVADSLPNNDTVTKQATATSSDQVRNTTDVELDLNSKTHNLNESSEDTLINSLVNTETDAVITTNQTETTMSNLSHTKRMGTTTDEVVKTDTPNSSINMIENEQKETMIATSDSGGTTGSIIDGTDDQTTTEEADVSTELLNVHSRTISL